MLMKKLAIQILILGAMFFSIAVYAQETSTEVSRVKKAERYVVQHIGLDGLRAKLKTDCITYTEGFRYAPHAECLDAVDALFKAMDAKGFVAFRSKSVEFAKDANVWEWIKYLKTELIKASATHAYFTVWGHTLKFTKRDRKLALAYLAVTFQMTDAPEDFSNQIKRYAPGEVVQAHGMLTEFFRPGSKLAKEYPQLKLYPKGFEDGLPQYIYHFYAPAYLSQLMLEDKVEERFAFFLPFLMNYEYEMFNEVNSKVAKTYEKASKAIESFGEDQKPEAVKPAPTYRPGETFIGPAPRNYRAEKVYLGYYGSLFGLELESRAAMSGSFTYDYLHERSERFSSYLRGLYE